MDIYSNVMLEILFIYFLVTTDSTTSEDDSIPPPLPAKMRESNDYSNLPLTCHINDNSGSDNYSIVVGRWGNRPLPAEPMCITNASYEYVEARASYDDKRRPPTPPPKPSRNSKYLPA